MKNVEKHVFFELYNHRKRIGSFDCYVHGETDSAAWEEALLLGIGMQYGINAIHRYKTKCALFVYEEGYRERPHYRMNVDYRDECAFIEYVNPREKHHNEIVCK